jgi:Outer membrane protein beta-barrel domain
MRSIIKASILSVIFAASISQSFAQWSVGSRVGINTNTASLTGVSASLTPDLEHILSYNIGAIVSRDFSENFALQGEVNYMRKGFKTTIGTNTTVAGLPIPLGATAITTLNYIDIPVLAKVKFGNEKIKGYALLGPSVNIALNGNIETRANFLVDIRLGDIPINTNGSDFNKLELAGVLGVGMSLQLGNGELFVDARYSKSFNNVYQTPIVAANMRNSGFNIGLGYIFHL